MKIAVWLSRVAGTAVPRPTSVVCAGLAAFLFFASTLLQLRASYSRWITFAGTLRPTDRSIESHEYDYYLQGFMPSERYLLIPDTGVPLGNGLLLQSVGIALLLLCVLTSGPVGAIRHCIQLLLGLLVMLSYMLIGYHALRTELEGTPPGTTGTGWSQLVILLGFIALVVLCVMSFRRFPGAAIAWFCLLGTTIFGYVMIDLFLAPVLTLYTSPDTTPGTETIMALTTAAAGLSMLVCMIALIRQGRSRPRPEFTTPA